MKSYYDQYVLFLKKFLHLPRQAGLSTPLSVVIDCSNGAAGPIVQKLKTAHPKLKIILLNQKPDGAFPAHGPDPLKSGALDMLQEKVKKERADIGIILDADGDRVFFVDNNGRSIATDAVALMMSKNLPGPIVLDLRAGYIAREGVVADGKTIIESRVGHYFIKKLMAETKSVFAAELSGHYYFNLLGSYFDSGLVAAIHCINFTAQLTKEGRTLSDWLKTLPQYYHSGELNFEVSEKQSVMQLIEAAYQDKGFVISHLDGIKITGDDFWFNVRASNTENLLRLNLEAKNKTVFDKQFQKIEAAIRSATK